MRPQITHATILPSTGEGHARLEHAQERLRLETERKALKCKMDGLYDAIADGLRSPGLKEKLMNLEGCVALLRRQLD